MALARGYLALNIYKRLLIFMTQFIKILDEYQEITLYDLQLYVNNERIIRSLTHPQIIHQF